MEALDSNCWLQLPLWECYAANIAGLLSTALWFLVLFPQVIKNFYRRSVKGLSFLWAVANFTASLVNLFFAFSISLPLYVRVMAVYMPCLELTILFQFFIYSQRPLTTRLLALLLCLLLWGTIIELELNLPQAREHIQWIAITLWSIETFPQLILNMKLQSTSGQSTISVVISVIGKSTDFFVTYGLNMPLEYVVMCYFSSSTTFINGFQVIWFGKDSWFNASRDQESSATNSKSALESHSDTPTLQQSDPLLPINTSNVETKRFPKNICYWCVMVVRYASLSYVVGGLVVFSVGLFWRTLSFFALLGPVSCLAVVVIASEYYRAKRSGRLNQCEDLINTPNTLKKRLST